jgi:hypothetical protein
MEIVTIRRLSVDSRLLLAAAASYSSGLAGNCSGANTLHAGYTGRNDHELRLTLSWH